MSHRFSTIALLTILVCGAMCSLSCFRGSGVVNTDIPPITRLANVPPPDTIITAQNPRLTLSWVGDDPDGYVVAFKYRW
ncbi:MAG TPA: hypothetical protein VKS81_10380, partial [Bacteroidota bacterium]|nr:hypothetical protein [Bacteroidota bacterium]